MRKAIRITGTEELINNIISQVQIITREEQNHINFLGRNEFSMIGMEYRTHAQRGGDVELVLEAENPMLFYKLGLYTAPLIKNILK